MNFLSLAGIIKVIKCIGEEGGIIVILYEPRGGRGRRRHPHRPSLRGPCLTLSLVSDFLTAVWLSMPCYSLRVHGRLPCGFGCYRWHNANLRVTWATILHAYCEGEGNLMTTPSTIA